MNVQISLIDPCQLTQFLGQTKTPWVQGCNEETSFQALAPEKYRLLCQVLASLAQERHWGTGEGLVEYHCNGQGAGALALQGEAEGTGFVWPKGEKAKRDLTAVFHYIKAEKTDPDSPQSCTEGKWGNRHMLQQGKLQLDRRKKSSLTAVLYWNRCPERLSDLHPWRHWELSSELPDLALELAMLQTCCWTRDL